MVKKELKVGQKVIIYVDPEEKAAASIVHLNGVIAFISRSKNVKSQSRKKSDIYFELQGVTSKFGIPFAFMDEWLIACD